MKQFDGEAPARFIWLPPMLRPPGGMTKAQERIFLLVGVAALFAGFDQNIYGFALPQIQASLHIPENQIGLTVTWLRLATFAAMLFAMTADIVGRRRRLLITIFGQGFFTLLTAFVQTYPQFVWAQVLTRVFGYAEEMLCYVVIMEEMATNIRGWSSGTLAGITYTGAGLAALCFAAVNILPGKWRALYIIGGMTLLFVAFLRRSLPETKRFEIRHGEVEKLHARIGGAFDLFRRLFQEYPSRILLILITVGSFGLAIGPSVVLAATYLQKALGYAPWQATALMIPGGLMALWLNILMGRMSDRVGRKRVVFLAILLCALAYAAFYSGLKGMVIPPLWILGFFGYFTADALLRGMTVELVPTAYRATVGGLSYAVEILAGGISLGLEGIWYDHFHAHGPAIALSLLAIPISLIALLFLPEPAGRTLEEISHA
jgi:putative MFS transporter